MEPGLSINRTAPHPFLSLSHSRYILLLGAGSCAVGKAVCQAQEGGWLAVTDRRLIRLSRVRLVSLLVVGFRLNQVSLVSLLGSVC